MPTRSQRKLWRSLRRRKGRERHGLCLAEGPRVVAELLDAGTPVVRLLHTRSAERAPEIARLLARAAEAGIPVAELGGAAFRELSDTVHSQGILAVATVPGWGWPDLSVPRILVLDGVGDPGNVGTLVRTAEACGLGGVVCLPGTADPWSGKVIRAAAGSTFRLPVFGAGAAETVERLGARGIALWAASPGAPPAPRGEPAPERLALVLGNETRGVSKELLGRASRQVSLPMAGAVESLNVAVAGGILMDRLLGG
ncbi:MAG: TrmH family RNA methyltransferase [Gemmatimonadota bacterium]